MMGTDGGNSDDTIDEGSASVNINLDNPGEYVLHVCLLRRQDMLEPR